MHKDTAERWQETMDNKKKKLPVVTAGGKW